MMKRSSKLALSLVLAIGASMPAMAQDNFPDVPANHWAFDALVKMKADGILVGYPDGLFRGTRPASRYELAVALNAAYSHLKSLIDGMQTQLDALKGINPQDIQNLKDEVAHLQDEVNAMKGWGDDIAALKKATEEFDKELRSLGVDVEAMKKDLGNLEDRVSSLEKHKLPVDISGDVSFFAVTTNAGTNHTAGLTQDGGAEGFSGSSPLGLFKDLTFLHEGAFTVASNNETGPKWKGTFVVGNMLGTGGFGSQSTLNAGSANQLFSEGREDVYIQDLSIKTDIRVIGATFNAEAGRVAYKLSPYMFQKPITESYFTNERWDDGKYRFDGAILGFNFGAAKLHIWGGNTSDLYSVNGVDQNPIIVSNNRTALTGTEGFLGQTGIVSATGANPNIGTIDQTAAADLGIGLGRNGHLSLGFLVLDQDGRGSFNNAPIDDLVSSGGGNRDVVYGGDADFGFGRFKVSGGFHQSDITGNTTSSYSSHDNQSWDVKAKYTANKFNAYGGYRDVEANYFAPGDWGRLGILQNPANIRGWQGGAYLDLTRAIRVTAEGEWDKGEGGANPGATDASGLTNFGIGQSPFDSSSNIRQLMARVDFRLNPNLSVFGSFQDVKFDNLTSGTAFLGYGYGGSLASAGAANSALIDWTTVGLGYGLSANAKFTLQYQFSNGGDNSGDRLNGGILSSQLSIKF
jgi:hypothetical protein